MQGVNCVPSYPLNGSLVNGNESVALASLKFDPVFPPYFSFMRLEICSGCWEHVRSTGGR